MFFSSPTRGYAPLNESTEDDSHARKSQPYSLTDRVIFWSTIVIVLCALLDVGAFLLVSFGRIKFQNAQEDVEDLPFRNMYAGLSRLYSDPSAPVPSRDPFSNVPKLLFAVDMLTDPHKLKLKPKEYRRTKFGLVWKNDMAFELGPSTVSVAQFRIMDWGMDNCVLKVVGPAKADAAVIIEPDVVEVAIWRLDAKRMPALKDQEVFDAKRVEFMGTFSLSSGSEHSVPFECHSGDLASFEFSSTQGSVSMTPDRIINLIGPYVIQSQST